MPLKPLSSTGATKPPIPGVPNLEPGQKHVLNILYVEDDEDSYLMSERSLRDHYQMTRAANSAEAFALMSKTQYDAILMDIQLAGSDLNGTDIVKAVRGGAGRGRNKDTPIVFVTAHRNMYSARQVREMGANDLVTKPVDFVQLACCVSRLLTRALTKSATAEAKTA